MKDLLGKAIYDEYTGNREHTVFTETSISEPEEFPVDYMLRGYESMPVLERHALDQSAGHVLDVGCGAGSHALYLQERGLEVTAIDISPWSVRTAKMRGVKTAKVADLYQWQEEKYDTILLLMNGSGILGKLNKVADGLKYLEDLMTPQGQILIDSSDLIYMYDEDDDGGKWVPGDRYYGELTFTVHYGDERESFPWLYLDYERLEEIAHSVGLKCEKLEEGEHYDFLARITHRSS